MNSKPSASEGNDIIFVICDTFLSGIEERFSSLIDLTTAKLRDPHVSFLVEGPITSNESHHSVILHGDALSSDSHLPGNSRPKENTSIVSCSEFFPQKMYNFSLAKEVS